MFFLSFLREIEIDFMFLLQQQQEFRAGSLPRSVRKESTSFEHSEPLPGNLTRWPMDGTGSGASGSRRPGESFVELTVTLQRHDSGFGFRIVGGTEEGSQVNIFLFIYNFLRFIYIITNTHFNLP